MPDRDLRLVEAILHNTEKEAKTFPLVAWHNDPLTHNIILKHNSYRIKVISEEALEAGEPAGWEMSEPQS